jgi:hypothetical protein
VIFTTKDRTPLVTAALHDNVRAFLKENGIAYCERYISS